MADVVPAAQLREYLAEALHAPGARVAVEYHGAVRDPTTARAVDKAARWLRRRARTTDSVRVNARVARVDVAAGGAGGARRLAALGVRLLPQPSTVVVYGGGGGGPGAPRARAARAGPVTSARDLVRQLGWPGTGPAR